MHRTETGTRKLNGLPCIPATRHHSLMPHPDLRLNNHSDNPIITSAGMA